jgi:hypothetical protein
MGNRTRDLPVSIYLQFTRFFTTIQRWTLKGDDMTMQGRRRTSTQPVLLLSAVI